jgi:ABC-type maltose transport system permease subunit
MTRPPRRRQQRSSALGKWIGIGLAVVAIIAIAFIVAAYMFDDFRVATRDIAIVILAVFQMIGAILTIVLLLAIIFAVRAIDRLARNTVIPEINALKTKLDVVIENTRSITGDVKDTTTTVSTTTVYMAERVVSPVIRVAGLVAGVRGAARFLARRGEAPEPDNG